jgi:hypothetical protein
LRYAARVLSGFWKGAGVYRSEDGGSHYEAVQTLNRQSVMGLSIDVLPTGTSYTWDKSSTVEVLLLAGELQSISELAVLNGGNACLLGEEIIQFQTATLLSPNAYRLSNLLRGRLGTEDALSSHVAGEPFVLLGASLGRELISPSLWSISTSYKTVPVGKSLSQVSPQNFTYRARALKPYAPVHIIASRDGSGNLTITWKRRTRLGGEWRDGVDVPLSEESERYEVDILDGVTVKRTFEGLTSPSLTYTASGQTSDFGSVQPSISVAVYQLSALVGRGIGGKVIL